MAQKLRLHAASLRAPVVGAVQVTCGDEAEEECLRAFHRSFVNTLLPSLKDGKRSHFRIANLGGRFEWGAVRVAEGHFATPESSRYYKLLFVKINSHVSLEETGRGYRFGHMERYHVEDAFCGALHALLDGRGQDPYIQDLRDAFVSEGMDRVAMLGDAGQVDPEHRSLYVAIVNARLQARRAALEIQEHRARTPTVYLVLPCVTLNQKGRDREIIVGLYRIDHRTEEVVEEYMGLGDDPSKYRLGTEGGYLLVEDDQISEVRKARDHRALVREVWEVREEKPTLDMAPDLRRLLQETAHEGKTDHPYARAALKTVLRGLATLNPITAAVVFFAEGIADIHHAHRAHRLAHGGGNPEEARAIIEEIHEKVDALPPEQVRTLATVLAREYGRRSP